MLDCVIFNSVNIDFLKNVTEVKIAWDKEKK